MRYWSQWETKILVSKSVLRAAVDATDEWIDDNQADYVASLPAAAQAGLTGAQMTFMFVCVALSRAGGGLLRRILGEVD